MEIAVLVPQEDQGRKMWVKDNFAEQVHKYHLKNSLLSRAAELKRGADSNVWCQSAALWLGKEESKHLQGSTACACAWVWESPLSSSDSSRWNMDYLELALLLECGSFTCSWDLRAELPQSHSLPHLRFLPTHARLRQGDWRGAKCLKICKTLLILWVRNFFSTCRCWSIFLFHLCEGSETFSPKTN